MGARQTSAQLLGIGAGRSLGSRHEHDAEILFNAACFQRESDPVGLREGELSLGDQQVNAGVLVQLKS
jgi:hypothetical protein